MYRYSNAKYNNDIHKVTGYVSLFVSAVDNTQVSTDSINQSLSFERI